MSHLRRRLPLPQAREMSRDPALPPTENTHRGRPRGGLRHEWGTKLAALKRLYQALKEHRRDLGWSIASSILGSCIGLAMVSLWLWSR